MSSPERVDTKYLGGEYIVSPGHPITLAYLIAKSYPPGTDFSRAILDDIVPGSMDSLSYAVNGLFKLKKKTSEFEEFKLKCDRYWSRICENLGQDGGQGAVAGQIQADSLAPVLEQLLQEWLR